MSQLPTRDQGPNQGIYHQNSISNNITFGKIRPQLNELIQKLKLQSQWNLSSKKYSSDNITYICENVEDRSHVIFLYLHWNQEQKMIKIPLVYPMSSLKILNIGANNIESLQLLQKGNFGNLQQLWLWFNKLVRVDSLRKCHFPSLKYLDIGDNHIMECPKLSEMHAPLLQRVNIEKNHFTHLNNFAKQMINSPTQFLLMFMDNNVIKAFHQPRKKGNRTYHQVCFTHNNGKANLKFN